MLISERQNIRSIYNFKRPYLKNAAKDVHIYDCSLSVFRNAQRQPYKYICKYFNVAPDEKSLNSFEKMFNDFSAAEQGKQLLKNKRDDIIASIKTKIPLLVRISGTTVLAKKLGLKNISFDNSYFPKYSFRYISDGGNSSMICDITFNLHTLEEFIAYLSGIIAHKKSATAQRALMNSRLREKIKARDNYTCQKCGISITDEPHLLLEIDHIVPISRGGVTVESNLQTLCWKCNRSKGSKLN